MSMFFLRGDGDDDGAEPELTDEEKRRLRKKLADEERAKRDDKPMGSPCDD